LRNNIALSTRRNNHADGLRIGELDFTNQTRSQFQPWTERESKSKSLQTENIDEHSAAGLHLIMKRQVITCGMAVAAAVSTCFAAPTPARQIKTAHREAAIVALEKIVSEAFKNKQVETFKKYLGPEFIGLDAEGFKNIDGELAEVPKYDVRDNSFANMKVTFPSASMAVVTYKVTTQATRDGQDVSGAYNVASVWTKRERKWRLVFHTFMKSQ
jgi:hypothetical protein